MQIRNGSFIHTDAMEYMRQMPNDSVDLIVTDPPYKVIGGGVGENRNNGYNSSVLNGLGNGKIFKHATVSISDMMMQFERILKPGTHCYVMTNRLNMREMLNATHESGLHLHNILRWDKNLLH